MYWNSSDRWQRRRGGNGWIIALLIVGLIILTHGWILLIPLIGLAALAFFAFVMPKIAWHAQRMHSEHGEWVRGNWSCGGGKRKNDSWGWDSASFGEKPKRDEKIEYV